MRFTENCILGSGDGEDELRIPETEVEFLSYNGYTDIAITGAAITVRLEGLAPSDVQKLADCLNTYTLRLMTSA